MAGAMTMHLKELREKYPQYDDLSDDQLTAGVYKKFYSDMPREEIMAEIRSETIDGAPNHLGRAKKSGDDAHDPLGIR